MSEATTALVVAGIALITSIASAAVTAVASIKWERERLSAEMRTEFMAEAAIRHLLQHEQWKRRSFDRIRKHVGGFDDNELRRILVGAGAVRFGEPNDEMWGLRERNLEGLR